MVKWPIHRTHKFSSRSFDECTPISMLNDSCKISEKQTVHNLKHFGPTNHEIITDEIEEKLDTSFNSTINLLMNNASM